MQNKPTEYRWYKGNLHTHTNLSDGRESPQEVVHRYRRMGYDFLAITDHRIYGIHEELSDDDLVILPGVELDTTISGDSRLVHHIVGIGIPGENTYTHGEKIEYPKNISPQKLASMLIQRGNLCIYAHPSWSHAGSDEIFDIKGIMGVEWYNHSCEMNFLCGSSEYQVDSLLRQGSRFWITACDDSHQKNSDWAGGWIMVKAKELTQEAIVQAISSGDFYASQGPQLHSFTIEGGKAELSCSPCASAGFLADTIAGYAEYSRSSELTSCTYTLKGNESYLRAVCIDSSGKKAMSQPIWLPCTDRNGVTAGGT